MSNPVERLWEFCCDINQNEVNDHIRAACDEVDGVGVATFCIDTEWLDGWHRAVDKLIGDIRRDYVELPVDADGVTVHFGDVLSQFGKPMRVYALTDPNESDAMANIVADDDYGDGDWVRLYKMRHYSAPTVKDMLTKFADEWHRAKTSPKSFDFDKLLAEYAAKLREVMPD